MSIATNPVPADATADRLAGDRAWFRSARFGVFVHFGIYTLRGGDESDRGDLSPEAYEARYIPQFDPAAFDADAWADAFVGAGARYVVLTSKHGEGFCLWDTAQTDFKITRTPFGRDLFGELAEACRRRGLRFGAYYAADNWYYGPDSTAPQARDYRRFVLEQVRELMTGYGQIDVLWLDGQCPRLPPDAIEELIDTVHGLQPTCVVNDRGIDHSNYPGLFLGDYVTPERHIPVAMSGPHPFVECCDAMGLRSWGYHTDQQFHSSPALIHRLTKCAALGANYLLNVEPQPDGRIRPECLTRLADIGQWLGSYGESVFDTNACPLRPWQAAGHGREPIGCATTKERSVYVHLDRWPASDEVVVPGLRGPIDRAELMGAAGLKSGMTDQGVRLTGIPSMPTTPNPVIRLRFAERPRIDPQAGAVQGGRVVDVCPLGPTPLDPLDAVLRGREGIPWHRLNRFADGRRSIGHFVRPGCLTVWRLRVERAGRYHVWADLGALDLQAGNEFTVSACGSSVRHTIRSTGHYATPETFDLGVLELEPGEVELVLEPETMRMGLCDVHGLSLSPVAPQRAS